MSSKTSWTSTGQDARAVVCFLRQWYIYWLRYNFFNCIQDILATAILYNHQHSHHHHHHHRLEYDFVGCILGIVVTDRLPMWQFKPNQYSDSCVLLFTCIHNKYIGLHLICMHSNTGIGCAFAKVWPQVNALSPVLSVLYVRIRILVWCVLVLLHSAHFHLCRSTCIYIFVFLFTVTL